MDSAYVLQSTLNPVLEYRATRTASEARMDDEPESNQNHQQEKDWIVHATEKDVTGDALKVCERLVLKPYRFALKGLGWLSVSNSHSGIVRVASQSVVITIFLLLIGATFVTQGILCFQRDLLILNMEKCVNNTTADPYLICCKDHIVSAFAVPDFLLISSYLFGIYLFSRIETEYLSYLAAKVFIKSISANGGKPPMQLVYTNGFYFLVGLTWIIASVGMRIFYLDAFSLWGEEKIHWSNDFQLLGPIKHGLIVGAIIGFVIFDVVYVASLMNYAIQSEMNICLLKAIGKLAMDKKYNNLDDAIKDINDAGTSVDVLNGKTAAGASLVIFNLSISAIVSLQQLDKIQDLTDPTQLARFSNSKTITVAFLNAVLWIAFVAFAFVQASRVTSACQELQKCGAQIRARPFQYAAVPQVDLDSFVLYSVASKLRAKLFGIPIFPWMLYVAAVLLPFMIIVLVKTDAYNLVTHF